MTTSFIASLSNLAAAYGSAGVLVIAFLEEILAPVPSLLSFMGAGFLVLPKSGEFGLVMWDALVKVALPAGIGLSLGAAIVYGVCYAGGEPFIRRAGRWFGLRWETIENLRERLAKSRIDELIVFSLRVIPFFPSVVVSAACGIIRYPFSKFLILTFFGGSLRAFLMGLLGWSLGEAYAAYASEFGNVLVWSGIAVLAILIISGGIYLGFRRRKRRKMLS